MDTCPRCGAPRPAALVECPRCGVIYAKAHALAVPAAAAAEPQGFSLLEDDAATEKRIRAWAIPVALAGAFLATSTGPGRALVRIFFGMWLHELGHAVAAWLCGFVAVPGPWRTLTGSARSPLFVALVSAALIYAVVRSWTAGRRGAAIAAAFVLFLQIGCTLLPSARTAQAFIVFSGDGGCLVLGTLLMASLYAPAEGAIRRNWLRWGFLVIGAGGFADAFEQWLSARTDPDRIPFGMNEGVGPSDPSVLSDVHGWSASLLVHRYVALGCVCLAALAFLYLLALRRARTRA